MSLTIDGHPIESLRLSHAVNSHWTARVQCEEYTPGQTATMTDDTTEWLGRVVFSEVVGSSLHVTLTGGAGDWDAEIAADHWTAPTTIGDVATRLAQSAGQSVESSAVPLPQWRHARSRLTSALSLLAKHGGVESWFQRPSGAIAFGVPDGAALSEPVGNDGESTTYDVGASLPFVLSPTVGRALYSYPLNAKKWRITTWPKATARTPSKPEWAGATVESQSDELVDLRLDDGSTRTGVPLWSMPGVQAKVPNGTRVWVYDVGGDPRATIAFAAQWTAEVNELNLAGGYALVIRDGEMVSLIDVPPPLGRIPPPLMTAGVLPTDMFFLKLAAPMLVALPGAPPLGPSKVKA